FHLRPVVGSVHVHHQTLHVSGILRMLRIVYRQTGGKALGGARASQPPQKNTYGWSKTKTIDYSDMPLISVRKYVFLSRSVMELGARLAIGSAMAVTEVPSRKRCKPPSMRAASKGLKP